MCEENQANPPLLLCMGSVEEEGVEFSLGHRRSDALENGAPGEDCAVEAYGASVLGEGAKEEVAARAAGRVGCR